MVRSDNDEPTEKLQGVSSVANTAISSSASIKSFIRVWGGEMGRGLTTHTLDGTAFGTLEAQLFFFVSFWPPCNQNIIFLASANTIIDYKFK